MLTAAADPLVSGWALEQMLGHSVLYDASQGRCL